jgi:hypothetical protein
MAEWLIKLRGHSIDLEDLANYLRSPGLNVSREEDGSFYLRSIALNSFASVSEAREFAVTLLPAINGALKIVSAQAEPVEVDYLHIFIDDQGVRHVRSISTLSGRARLPPLTGAGQGIVTTPPAGVTAQAAVAQPPPVVVPPTQVESLLASAKQQDVVRLALHFFGYRLNWFNLWKVWELIRDDLGGSQGSQSGIATRGRQEIEKRGWATSDEIQDFRHTANTYDVSGEDARHVVLGEKADPRRNRLSLGEGEAFIRSLLEKWLATK